MQNHWYKWHWHWSPRHSLKSWAARGNTIDLEKEKQAVLRSAMRQWLNDESVNWRQWCSKKDNQWTSTFRSYWGQCQSKMAHAPVNPVGNGETRMYLKDTFISSSFETWLAIDEDTQMNVIEWWKDAHHQDWLWNNVALEGQSYIVILWNMVIDRCNHTTALNECRKGTHPED